MKLSRRLTEREKLQYVAWRDGHLAHKLDEAQRAVYDAIRSWQSGEQESDDEIRWFLLDIGRRFGKSTIMLTHCFEEAIRHRGLEIKYASSTQKSVKDILLPIVTKLTRDCPTELLPRWSPTELTWIFSSGSRVKMSGCDKDPDSLRGTESHRAYVDEGGFIDRLRYVVEDILIPQTASVADPFFLMGSTPPVSPAHDWSAHYTRLAKSMGCYVHRKMTDSPRYSERRKAEMIARAGGPTSTVCRREYFAEHVVETDFAIVPEYSAAVPGPGLNPPFVRVHQTPAHRDRYVALDPGFTHLCAALFGYWDFREQKLIVERDFAIAKANTAELAKTIRDTERDLWGEAEPYLRVSDTDIRLIADLSSLHGIRFVPTAKDDRDAAIADLRVAIQRGQVVINPACKNLIAHLEHGVWNRARTSFAESGDYGHFDAIAALVYLWRNVQRARNPFPELGPGVTADTHFIRPRREQSAEMNVWPSRFARR